MGDLRTKRTYKLLYNALFELMQKKAFDDIKVNDICDIAMVHRTTFYSHFSDKYELLDYCINQIEQEILGNHLNSSYSSLEEFYTNMIMQFLNYVDSNRKFFRAILKKNEDSGFLKILNHACISYISEMLLREEKNGITHHVPIEIISEFYSGAVISTISWWIRTNSKLSKDKLCEFIVQLIFENEHK